MPADADGSSLCHVDKIEDAKAKAAVKAQIEVRLPRHISLNITHANPNHPPTHLNHKFPTRPQADKRERAEKAAREKAIRAGEAPPPELASQAGPALGSAGRAAAAATTGKGSDNPETRLQVSVWDNSLE